MKRQSIKGWRWGGWSYGKKVMQALLDETGLVFGAQYFRHTKCDPFIYTNSLPSVQFAYCQSRLIFSKNQKKKKRLHMKICDILERTQIFTLFNTNFRASYLNPFGIAAMCWKAVTLFTGLRFSGWANEKWEFSPWQCACSTVWSPCFFCFLTSYQCLLPIAAHIFLEWSMKAKQGRGLEKSLWSQGAAEPLSSCHFQPVV